MSDEEQVEDVVEDGVEASADESDGSRCEVHPGVRVFADCAGCGRPLCSKCAVRRDGESIGDLKKRTVRCVACTAEAEAPKVANIPKAAVIGAVGALIGAGIWALVVVYAHVQVGYIAWGIGLLAGGGVLLGAGGARGKPYQITAAACAAGGLFVGKYQTLVILVGVAWEKENNEPCPFGMFSPEMFHLFKENLGNLFGGFDLLWIFLAVGTAWQMTASSLAGASGARAAGAAAARRRRSQ